MDWIFNGIGTEIVIFLLGLGGGSIICVRINKTKKKSKQTQIAGNNAKQSMINNQKT